MKQFLNSLFFFVPIVSFCQQSYQEKSENGSTLKWQKFEINNNKWGENKVKKGTYSQTIFTTNTTAGWKWETSGKKYGVIGYPEIWFGESAWVNLSAIKTDNYFKNINELKTFDVEYKTKLNVDNKKYNLAFDFWLHNSPKVALETIGIEVMIWEDYNKFKPFGKKVGNVFTSFGEYDIYKGHLIKKDLNTTWDYIAFVRKEKRTSGKVNVIELINEMNKRNFIKQNIYLSSFEFGTEILNSTGNILIEDYKLNIE
ncbi:GH12 family glycosyl hydrolase domain-containing protein [Empedobacter brevis]|uniref:GH12 family glycosyl hydrolase domain-containing protein n=1 Tax=Empedobacter brevis TaxID=247 RepID=UPI0039B0F152